MTSPPKDRQDSGTDPAAIDPAERERPTWRCFHCDEVFTDRAEAQDHFGPSEQQIPACFIDVRHVRWLEEQHRRNVEDDTEALRTIRGLAGEHEELRRRAEEQGYARGLADAKKHPEELGLAALSSLSPELEAWSRARDAEQPPSQEAAHPVAWIDRADFKTLEECGWCVVHAARSDPGSDHAAEVPLYAAHPVGAGVRQDDGAKP